MTTPSAVPRWPYLEMLLSSAISLFASFVLAVDAVVLAANSNAELSCNINEKISCGAVAASWQAKLFGWPNAFLGLATEPVVITIAVLGLSRVVFPRWFMLTAQVGYTIGFGFALWLFAQSYLYIGALCPWCLTVTVTTTLVFTSMTRINLQAGHFGDRIQRATQPALAYHADVYGSILFLGVLAAAAVYRYS